MLLVASLEPQKSPRNHTPSPAPTTNVAGFDPLRAQKGGPDPAQNKIMSSFGISTDGK